MRSDAPLIRYLSKTYNPKLGLLWQQLPFIEIDAPMVDRIRERVGVPEPENCQNLPWTDFVLLAKDQLHRPDESGETTHVFIRCTSRDEYLGRNRRLAPWFGAKSPWIYQAMEAAPAQALITETWVQEARDDMFGPSSVVFDRAGEEPALVISPQLIASIDTAVRRGTPRDQLDQMAEAIMHGGQKSGDPTVDHYKDLALQMGALGLYIIAYLSQCPEYLVEETPEIPEGTPPRRQNDPKPWTYNYLPRIILLDPTQAPSGELKPYQGGTHASPRPHQRRGHWATLKASRFYQGNHSETHNPETNPRRVFVKPAWVGPREWVMQGSRYRVLNVEGQS